MLIEFYEAVTASSMDKLNEKVADLLLQGYQPFGGISTSLAVDDDYDKYKQFSQAMVKYKSQNKSAVKVKD